MWGWEEGRDKRKEFEVASTPVARKLNGLQEVESHL